VPPACGFAREGKKHTQETKIIIIISTGFRKNVASIAYFILRSENLDLFILRVLPFPFWYLSVLADSASPGLLLFAQICLKGQMVGHLLLFGSAAKVEKNTK
jgi:hypothetical protein